MSVAVGHTLPNGENVARIVIRKLVARDAAARVDVVIEPGASIESFQIHRNSSDIPEAYSMEFESDGRQLRCALVEFQARTQTAMAAAHPDVIQPAG